MFSRNIYNKILEWKRVSNGKTALLVEGARRTGKSTIVEEFAKNEYKSYIKIDFGDTKNSYNKSVKKVFEESESLDEFFSLLQLVTGIKLYPRESIIIFDEIQKNNNAREMIKHLVADGRFDFIETGSLISIKKNSSKIVIPSEEEKIQMYPMTFDEFLIAINEDEILKVINECFFMQRPLHDIIHKKAMNLFRTYMAVGGMPQAVATYIETKDFELVDKIKKDIINLYREDLEKISRIGSSVTPLIIYDNIQSMFSNHTFEITASSFSKNTKLYTCLNNVKELEKSKIVNVAYEIKNIDPTLSLGFDMSNIKVYSGDTGLLISKMFMSTPYLNNPLYKSIILDKLSIDEGFLFENIVAQMLTANGHILKYNTFYKEGSTNLHSIDFLITNGKKINPIEVKSSNYRSHSSIDAFAKKYHQYVDKKYVIYSKNYIRDNDYIYLPVYMTFLL
ncbi:MAG: ATP-binding protein [Anaeroplasma sp.]